MADEELAVRAVRYGELELKITVKYDHSQCSDPRPHPQHQLWVSGSVPDIREFKPQQGKQQIPIVIQEDWCPGIRGLMEV